MARTGLQLTKIYLVINIIMDTDTKLMLSKCAELCEKVYSEELDYIVDESVPGYQIFAIEGTKEKIDWFTNIKFLFRANGMHRGFKANAERTMVRAIANGHKLNDDKKLVLTGHSLGGASAVCLADLLKERFPDLTIVTFGAPRPGNRCLRDRLASFEHYRYRHGDDIVPLTPPWLTGYVHTAPVIMLEDANDRLLDRIQDHNIGSYRIQLNKYLLSI